MNCQVRVDFRLPLQSAKGTADSVTIPLISTPIKKLFVQGLSMNLSENTFNKSQIEVLMTNMV